MVIWYEYYQIESTVGGFKNRGDIIKNNFSQANQINYDIVIRMRPDIFINDNEINLISNIPNN